MSQPKKLSLKEAILINMNIMLGTGTFVNTAMLAHHVGFLGSFLYMGAGLLMLPLSFCFARLAQIVPNGNFYTFGSVLGNYWGFISTWSYFVGKLASASLSIHVFITFLQKTVPALQVGSPLFLDCLLISFFTALNLLDVKTGSKIQYFFLSAKTLPIIFIVLTGLHYVDFINLQAPHLIWEGIPIAFPLILFCFLGLEATCSLSRVIEDPAKNIGRSILISFGIVLCFIIAYQTIFYLSVGSSLGEVKNYVEVFPLFFMKTMPSLLPLLSPLLSAMIGVAALGGAYGILYSNSWNLYTLAEQNSIPFASSFKQLNKYTIPYLCVIAEGFFCCCYILWFKGAQIPLQYAATLSCIVTYTISVLGLLKLTSSFIGYLGLLTCSITLFFSVQGFLQTSIMPLVVLGTILTLGTLTYWVLQLTNLKSHQSN